MASYQKVLLSYLAKPSFQKEQQALLRDEIQDSLKELSSEDCASLYVDVAYLTSTLQFLKDEHWLQKKEEPFRDFVAPFFLKELSPLSYLQNFFEKSSLQDLKKLQDQITFLEETILAFIKAESFAQQKIFAIQALHLMVNLFELENTWQLAKKVQGLHLGISMYRTFDGLDKIFNLNYQADVGMKTDLQNTERLYEGAGIGVQSGYSTVLLALQYLKPIQGARFVDLGSGYGRVGLIVGLTRPDMDFKGYEFVEHRVNIASISSENLGLQGHVHFYTQDLSQKDFKIPEAEIYYMYDPFSEETYGHVLAQLIEISRHKKIFIATKGNARKWLLEVARKEGWSEPFELDSGNLCLFHS